MSVSCIHALPIRICSVFLFVFVLFANFQQDCFTVLKKSLIPDLCTSALKAEATQTEDTVVKNYAA